MGPLTLHRASRDVPLSRWKFLLLAYVVMCAACALPACPAWAHGSHDSLLATAGEAASPQADAENPPHTATLTIISSTANAQSGSFDQDGMVVWVNKDYAIQDGDTVESLLNAALAGKDLDAVDVQSGPYGPWLNSITSSWGVCLDGNGSTVIDGETAYLYWSLFDNGDYASTGIGDVLVKDGGTYQLVWLASTYDSNWNAIYHTGAPTTPQGWEEFYALNVPDPAAAGVSPDPVRPVEPAPGTTQASQDDIHDIMTAIANSYDGTSDPWQALDLAALGMSGKVDGRTLLEEGLAAIKDAGANSTAAQRYVIALTALGYDATRLPDGDVTYDAVAAMAKNVHTGSLLNVRLATLWAYASGGYVAPAYPSIDQLVESVMANQLADGGFSMSGPAADADMTAMAISALAPYAKDSGKVQDALNAALNALRALQGPNGAWMDKDGVENSNSTAFAIIALCAAGIDPAHDWASSTGVTPIDALLGFALPDNDGFAYSRDTGYNAMSTEQGFRALIAQRGLVAQDGAYSIYADAGRASVTIPSASMSTPEASGGIVPVEMQNASTSVAAAVTDGATGTGDAGATTMLLAFLVMLCALACACGAHAARRSQG